MDKTYIKTNDRLVNLENVSNINVLPHDRRIIFNLNYSIEIERNGDYKYISDYVYWDLIDDKNFQYALDTIEFNTFIMENFIQHAKGHINKNEISSVKFSVKKNRVIFNLSHPVTFVAYDGYTRITSEFVYVDFKEAQEYKTFSRNTEKYLLGEETNGN